jgi:hypothetical protein
MSVNPGFGGQGFIPSTLPKIAAVRARIDAYERDSGAAASGSRSTAGSRSTTSPRLPALAPTPSSPARQSTVPARTAIRTATTASSPPCAHNWRSHDACAPLAVRAVLIDLDGTLLDTVLDLHAAANAMLRRPRSPRAAGRSRSAAMSGAAFPIWSSACWPGRWPPPTMPRHRRPKRWPASSDTTVHGERPQCGALSRRRRRPQSSQGPWLAAWRDHQQGRSLHRAACSSAPV